MISLKRQSTLVRLESEMQKIEHVMSEIERETDECVSKTIPLKRDTPDQMRQVARTTDSAPLNVIQVRTTLRAV